MSALTNLFKRMPVSHIHKLTIQIQLVNPPEGSIQQALTCGVPNGQIVPLADMVQFRDLELEARFDVYKQPIMSVKGFQTVHDNYHERQLYQITNPNQVIEIRLQQDFSPMENVKKLYMFTRPTTPTTGEQPNSDLATAYLQHKSDTMWPSTSMVNWFTGEGNARYWTLSIMIEGFPVGTKTLHNTTSSDSTLTAQAFTVADGTRRILLVNKGTEQISVGLESPYTAVYVDDTTGDAFGCRQNCTGSVSVPTTRPFVLGTFGVGVVTLSPS
eukprot:Hpha_TRINITY_DN16131_c4_g1::TRINITY_DN16131_c4_g1_i2::g.4555::m.4555